MIICGGCSQSKEATWTYCPYCGARFEEVERAHGVKLDAGKSPVWQGFIEYFPLGMQEVALVSMKGTAEPGHVWGGWKSVPDGYARYSNAMCRHMTEEASIPIVDLTSEAAEDHTLLEAKLKACATVAWNAMARLEHLIKDFEV